MNRLSAHLGYLYTEMPLAERIAAAARDGFTAIEHPAPFAMPAAQMRARITDLGLAFAQITSGMGDAARDEKGLAALPGREAEFRAGFDRALEYAAEVGIPFVHPMAGVPKGAPGWQARYRGNIDWALQRVQGTGQRLLVEAITLPGYALPDFDAAIALQQAAGDDGLRLLFDSYHAAVLGEDGPAWIARHGHRIGHVHIADHPGRHEPGTGQLDFRRLLTALHAADYRGAIGFEYIPERSTAESVTFLQGWSRSISRQTKTGALS